MKELSIEEKAKRYDEAIEKTNSLWHYKNQPCIIDVSEIFPELEKNEDEEIRQWLIGYFQEYKSNDVEAFSNGLKIDIIIAWLAKQNNVDKVKQQTIDIPFGAKNSELQEATYYIPEGYYAEINGNEIVIKKGEQKPVDKVEPIFEVGKLVVANKSKYTFLVKRGAPRYQAENTNGDIYSFYLLPNGEEEYHLWTIEDAKDGDVLVYGDNQNHNHVEVIMLFKSVRNERSAFTHFHVFIDQFRIDDWCDCGKSVHPATKEQRDLLFAKMKEAGYKWDVEKKELKSK